MSIRVYCSDPISGKANPDYYNSLQHHLWCIVWSEESQLEIAHARVGRKISFRAGEGEALSHQPVSLHLYSNFECLREGEAFMLGIARMMLEFDVAPEAEVQLDTKDEDSDWESLSFEEQQRLQMVSPGLRKKQTYRAINGKTPIQTPDWREVAMTSFNFEDNPFQRIQEEIDQLQCQYSKMEYLTKGACKLLGDYKPIDLCKELEKVVQKKDTMTLEANNATLVA